MKTVESSAVFQPKQLAEKASREDNRLPLWITHPGSKDPPNFE